MTDFCKHKSSVIMIKRLLLQNSFYLLLAGCFAASGIGSAQEINQEDGPRIVVSQTPAVPPGSPRMPAYNPFYAEIINGNVLLGCVSSYGVVDVNLTSTAGDDYSTEFDTSTATIIIPTSGNSGDYTLLITTPSGLEFIGEFSL